MVCFWGTQKYIKKKRKKQTKNTQFTYTNKPTPWGHMDKLQCYSTNTREGIQVGSVLLVRNRESNGLDLPKPPHGYKLPPQHLPTPLSELSCLMWLAVTLDWPRKGSATMGISIDWDITMPWEEGGLSWICCCCICALSIISCVSE